MAIPFRKSLGAVKFDISEFSPSAMTSPARKRRSIAAPKVVDTSIEENDDEAERLARREKNEVGTPTSSTPVTGADRRQSTFGLSSISNLTAAEMSNQIAQCIKLSAENKINDKNAFQLKMIDFLVYSLKKQDPNMTNLQMASASLDASAKIYGFRVDKVHSDLLKVIGMAKQDKRDHQDDDNEDSDQPGIEKNEIQKKKKKKSRQYIITTVDALTGNVETYDPTSLIRNQGDTQTSDMLFQAGIPWHANQGIALNLYNDVILDQVPQDDNNNSTKIVTCTVDDFTRLSICPSYAAFKFLDWSPDDEPDESKSQDEHDGEYHFDLDAAVADDADDFNNDTMMDCGDAFEKRCDRQAQNNQHFENIVDFQDIIANNPNPNVTYEYSYIQKSYKIHWAGPSHWKITLNKNFGGSRVVETCKQNATKKKKEIEVIYTQQSKEESEIKFRQISANNNRQPRLTSKTMKQIWSEDKVTFPQDVHFDLKRFNMFFNKPSEDFKFIGDSRIKTQPNNNDENEDDFDLSNFATQDDRDNYADDNDEDRQDQNPPFTQESVITQSQGAFIGDNLVSVPKLTDKIFIPYSQRAKKIDMRQLKRVMWKNVRKTSKEVEKENYDTTRGLETESNKDIEAKPFSDIYSKLPKMLSKQNADSLSPAIAFVCLLHLANDKNLKIDNNNELSDLIIKNEKSDNVN